MQDGNLDREALAARLEDFGDAEALDLARQSLLNSEARLVLAPASHPAAGELLKVWEVRAQISKLTGHKTYGATALAERLRLLRTAYPVRLLGLETPKMYGLFFLGADDCKFIGLVLTEKRDLLSEQERLNRLQHLLNRDA